MKSFAILFTCTYKYNSANEKITTNLRSNNNGRKRNDRNYCQQPNTNKTRKKIQNNDELNFFETNNLKRNKRENIQTLRKQKIVITANAEVSSSGITLNDKLYFGSYDHNVYEYDPATGQQKVVITANAEVSSSGIALNNKLYFGSDDGKVYEYDPVTKQQKVVITTNFVVRSSGIVFKNKLYFGSDDYKVYEYDPATEQQKVVITTNDWVWCSGIALNNKLYFGSDDYKVYEYDPATNQQKIIIRTTGAFRSSGIVFNDKLYFVSYDHNVYEYYPLTNQQKIVITTSDWVRSSGIVLNDKLYFGSDDYKVYKYDPATNQQKIVITTGGQIWSSGVVFNNKLYFGSNDGKVYEYDPATNQQKIVITTGGQIWSSGVVFNNKLYFGSNDGKVYEYYLTKILSNIITNNNLKKINNNSDEVILNELNYLNLNLDISQLEIVEKTNISVTIKVKKDSDKYFGEKKIWYTINNQENKIINLNELIKKGIFLSYRDKNQGITIKEIKNINSDNLIYSNVTATKNIEPTYTKNSKSICFGTTTLFNNLPQKQNMQTPSCKYTKEKTLSSQITTGLSKTEGEEKNTEQSYISSMEHNWNIELSASATVWPFAEASATAGTGGSYSSSSTKTSSETKTLSNTFDFSSNKTNEYKEVSEVELPSQEIEVNPNQKIKVTASLDEVLGQVTLKLTQNIYGEIISQITNTSNEEKSFEISIKEIMQKLKEYNLLPQEITINNDDSITFNGGAHMSLKQGFDGNIEFHEVK